MICFHLWSPRFGHFVTSCIFQTNSTKSDYPTVSFTFSKDTGYSHRKVGKYLQNPRCKIAQKRLQSPTSTKAASWFGGLVTSVPIGKTSPNPAKTTTRSGSAVTNRRRLVLGVLGAKLTAEKWSIHGAFSVENRPVRSNRFQKRVSKHATWSKPSRKM